MVPINQIKITCHITQIAFFRSIILSNKDLGIFNDLLFNNSFNPFVNTLNITLNDVFNTSSLGIMLSNDVYLFVFISNSDTFKLN